MALADREPTSFGRLLRQWRTLRRTSQLALATSAGTTPRHVSFLETGRSRPGPDLVLRLGEALTLPVRDRNALLRAAGLRPVFSERALDEDAMQPYVGAIRALLESHEPHPANASDPKGRILLANRAHTRVFPLAEDRTPEAAIDDFFARRADLDFENWNEVA